MSTIFVLMIAPFLAVPALIARYAVDAPWNLVAKAYGLWLALVYGLIILSTGLNGEAIGWATILNIFFATPGVPFVAWFLKRRATRAART